MIQAKRRKDVNFGNSKVCSDILILRVSDDGGMTHGILMCLVDPRVQRSHVHVLDLFPLVFFNLVVELGSIGTSTKEGIPWGEGFHTLVGRQELLELFVDLDLMIPLVLPLHDQMVAMPSQTMVFGQSRFVHFLESTGRVEFGVLITPRMRVAERTAMPQTPIHRLPSDWQYVALLHYCCVRCDLPVVTMRCSVVGDVPAMPTISWL